MRDPQPVIEVEVGPLDLRDRRAAHLGHLAVR